jgi:hypothetical protein
MCRHHSELALFNECDKVLDLGLGIDLVRIGLLVGVGRLVARGGVGERHVD